MNILLLATHLNPGGIARYVVTLAKELSLTERVFVASAGGVWEEALPSCGVTVKRIPIDTKSIISPKILFSFIRLVSFVKKNKVDIVHANTRATQALAFLLCKLCGIPYVSAYHGFYKPRIFRRICKLKGQAQIAVSDAVKQHLIDDLFLPGESIRVIHNGIEAGQFQPNRAPRVKRAGIVLGILGRVSEEKGHFLAIDAFKVLCARHSDIFLDIAGQGRLRKKLTQKIKEAGLGDRVRFVDQKGEDFLDTIDILIAASSKEGFGYSILEAFAKEVCVCAFSTGGIKEIVRDGENGFLFYEYTPRSLAKRIEDILENQELKKRAIENAKVTLAQFTLTQTASATRRLYQEVLKG